MIENFLKGLIILMSIIAILFVAMIQLFFLIA